MKPDVGCLVQPKH